MKIKIAAILVISATSVVLTGCGTIKEGIAVPRFNGSAIFNAPGGRDPDTWETSFVMPTGEVVNADAVVEQRAVATWVSKAPLAALFETEAPTVGDTAPELDDAALSNLLNRVRGNESAMKLLDRLINSLESK